MAIFKKLCTGMLAAAMCFTFAACDGSTDNSGNSGGKPDNDVVDAEVYDGLELHYQSSNGKAK